MAGRATQTIEDWTYGPARWLGAGLLAGAAAIGMVWSYSARRIPADPVPLVQLPAPSGHRAPAGVPHETSVPAKPDPDPPKPIITEIPPAKAVPPPEASPPKPVNQAPLADPAKSPRIINVNAAGVEDLEKLPGIGPALASRIVDDRSKNGPYRKIQDLERVKGIGPKLIEKMRPFIVVE